MVNSMLEKESEYSVDVIKKREYLDQILTAGTITSLLWIGILVAGLNLGALLGFLGSVVSLVVGIQAKIMIKKNDIIIKHRWRVLWCIIAGSAGSSFAILVVILVIIGVSLKGV
jgi:hypothetical protein